ncbi:MAG: molybdate ABC transporter substrate-binding protein [Rhodopila sp.]
MMRAIRRLAVVIACLAGLAGPASAADLMVLSAGAITAVAQAITSDFEAAHGVKIVLRTDTTGGLVKRINGGDRFDVALMTRGSLSRLAKAGFVASGSDVVLAKVGVGIKAGTPAPNIGSLAAFKATLLAAPSIAYIDPASGGTSGIYLANLFETLGIADAVAAKSVLVKGGLAAETLVDGRAALALQQISEILAVPGVTLVGPLPDAVQRYTTYSGAIGADTQQAEAARAFLATMTGPAARATMKARGMNEP